MSGYTNVYFRLRLGGWFYQADGGWGLVPELAKTFATAKEAWRELERLKGFNATIERVEAPP